MNRRRTTTVIFFGFFIAVLVASAAVLIGSQYQRAERAEARVADVEQKLTAAEATEAALEITEENLDTTRSDLLETSRTLDRTAIENAALTQRDRDCRVLVQVSDELLFTSTDYQKVVDHLVNSKEWHADRMLQKVNTRIQGILVTIEDAGYGTISDLIEACTPASSPASPTVSARQ